MGTTTQARISYGKGDHHQNPSVLTIMDQNNKLYIYIRVYLIMSNDIKENEEKYEKKFARIATAIVRSKDPVDQEIVGIKEYYANLKSTEDAIARRVAAWIKHHPIYNTYLEHIQGIGPIFSANLISMLTPITDFPKPSMLVSYAGLSGSHYDQECKEGHKFLTSSPKTKCPVNLEETDKTDPPSICGAEVVRSEFVNKPMKRRKGYHLFANSRLKTTLFKIASSFEKQSAEKSQYRKLYDEKKALYLSRPDFNKEKGYKGHARLMAMRYIEKRFLVNLHVVWMTALGYDVTPYEATLPNHTIEPIRADDGYRLPGKGSMKPTSESENWTITQLTNSYYDIQKMRIKCFNNIVAWVKSNPDKVKDLMPADDGDVDEE